MKRVRLVLARETLAPLTGDDLADVNGGRPPTYYTCPTRYTGLTVCGICQNVAVHSVESCLTCPCA